MNLLIRNGLVVAPAEKEEGTLDILIEGGKIAKIAKNIKASAGKIIDATGKVVMPGIVDMHVHLRQPGREDKETVASATRAALKGGVTSVLAMPNTEPAIDSGQNVKLLKNIIKADANCNVFISGAISKGRLGKELTDIGLMKKEGAVAITDDGSSVESQELLLAAFKKAKVQGITVICHCEDKALSNGGVVNLGIISTRLGLRGISKESEYKRIERDIQLARKAGAAIHIAHVSCKESVELIAQAKKKGIRVTAETAPHYFSLTENDCLGYDTNMKMNPPLRTSEDVKALKDGLKRGIIDVIASDHAPHTENEKDIEFDRAEFGVIGLETELAVSITELVKPGVLGWKALVEKLSLNPAQILGLNKGTLAAGRDADIVIIDPDREWSLRKDDIVSQSKNSPFIGRKLNGLVEYTIYNGKIVYNGIYR